MSTTAYRITTARLDGPLNMAIDELLWRTAGHGNVSFRLYSWSAPYLSLGYFQSVGEIRKSRCWQQVCAVRRMTGGGAILHGQDLTYSLTMPTSLAPLSDSLYSQFHSAFARALVTRGVPAQIGFTRNKSTSDEFLCFRRTDQFAVSVSGCKVLGSAQRRRRDAVLMHGSVILTTSALTPDISGLRELVGRTICTEEIAQLLTQAAETALGLQFESTALPQDIGTRAKQLADEKYRCPNWNAKR